MTTKRIIDYTRAEVIAELSNYFKLSELVCPHVVNRHGSNSWQFLDTEALRVLLILRTRVLRVPLVCNTSRLTQRGLRCNLCELVATATKRGNLYLTPHKFGKAWDLTSPQMTAAQMRQKILANKSEFPMPIRIELDVNWLHVDTFDNCKDINPYCFRA